MLSSQELGAHSSDKPPGTGTFANIASSSDQAPLEKVTSAERTFDHRAQVSKVERPPSATFHNNIYLDQFEEPVREVDQLFSKRER